MTLVPTAIGPSFRCGDGAAEFGLEDGPAYPPDRMTSSANGRWHESERPRGERWAAVGLTGVTIWFTGLSGSGKSTVAVAVEDRLLELGRPTYLLDGDNLRHGLNGDLGFSSADRQENIRRAGELAKLSLAHGNITLACFISPFAADRQFARGLVPDGRFLEIYVKCDMDVVKRRDTKGLYAKALAGEIADFTGISSPYEEPAHPELIVETDLQTVDEIVERILAALRERKILG